MIIYSCSDVNGISEPDQERNIDWVIQNRPQDLLAVIAEFPDEMIPQKTNRNIVLIDYYNPQTYKIVSDTIYRPDFVSFSPDKKKIIFGDSNYYIFDSGPTLVLYDLEENTFLRIYDNMPGIGPVWNYEGTGFYFTNVPAWGFQNLYYYDFLTNRGVSIHARRQQKTYVVDIVGPDTLIVFSNDTLTTGKSQGYYYMSNDGQFLSRINNDKLIYYNMNNPYPYLYPFLGKLRWYKDLQLFAFEDMGDWIPGGYIDIRFALTNQDGSYYKFFPLNEQYNEYGIGWNNNEMEFLILRGDINVKIKLLRLDYKTGKMKDYLIPQIIPSCIGFWQADF